MFWREEELALLQHSGLLEQTLHCCALIGCQFTAITPNSRCQEVARQTCTVVFEGRQVMCFEITVGPCEFAAWVTYWWYDPFIFNTLDTYSLPQVLLTQANPLAEVSQLLPSRLHSSQQTYTMFWTFFFSPFAKGTAERVREKSWIRREHTEMARAVLAAELCVLHSLHPYTEGEAISSPNLH